MTGMKNPAIIIVTLAVAIIVFCAAFLKNPPAPRFHPVERVWSMPDHPAASPAMGWYGRTGVALGAAIVVSGISLASLTYVDRRKPFVLNTISIYALTAAVLLCLAVSMAGIVREQRDWFTKKPAVHKPDHEY